MSVPIGSFLGGVASGVTGGGVTSVSSSLDFLQGLTSKNLWIRVAKVAIGGVILIVGLAKLTNIQNSVVGKAVKVAPLL